MVFSQVVEVADLIKIWILPQSGFDIIPRLVKYERILSVVLWSALRAALISYRDAICLPIMKAQNLR